MSRPQPRELVVISSTLVTPHMLRVTLGGENISTMPEDQESGYVKLIFPSDSGRLMRTYTIRKQRADAIDIDFMLHEDSGPASSWAKNAKPGDRILVGGPGPKKMIEESAEWQLLIGDMTALPAISVNLETLPASAKGYAVIEVVSEDDIQPLNHPAGIELKWVINSHPGSDDQALLKEVQALNWLSDDVSVWAACEFGSMKALRRFFKEEKKVPKDKLYISSYWKQGSNEDQHKAVKRADAETV
ncbi:siderophore-interacting protein [Marinomonas pollencensis]|uniref:NADPH-dependent ferric siderophore reductase n=1 Tax=Marinomonas pollencensis TaxID=491954 RepID=A0A3E0DTQ2_9GAMM|nr:siderophore-interacting protein [Marinomonas pollencensis]REG85522.1 NADPH-dependent ferric siderophore reductase [Marinomonas pollencensis]